MPAVSIVPVQDAADLAAVRGLFRHYVAALGIDLSFQGFERELATLPGAYAPPRGALLLARTPGGEPVGCVALRPFVGAGTAELKRLYVAPTGRARGVGRALVERVLAEARRIGYREVLLDTLPSMVAAVALYRVAGFVPTQAYYDTPLAGMMFFRLQL